MTKFGMFLVLLAVLLGSCSDFGEEALAAVKIGDKGWGYINKAGEIVINPQFDLAGYFSEGLAAVSIGDKYGFINPKGEIVINPQFDDAQNFSK